MKFCLTQKLKFLATRISWNKLIIRSMNLKMPSPLVLGSCLKEVVKSWSKTAMNLNNVFNNQKQRALLTRVLATSKCLRNYHTILQTKVKKKLFHHWSYQKIVSGLSLLRLTKLSIICPDKVIAKLLQVVKI